MTLDAQADHWRRLSQLFDRALDLHPVARKRLLDRECAHDRALRVELEAMLAADAAHAPLDAGAAALIGDDLLSCRSSDDRDAERRDEIGRQLGHWRLERVLGHGGMGTVYAARRDDHDTNQRAAIKRLHRRWDGSMQAQRFLAERRILAALSHPHIPRLLDHGTDADARPWFALELVEGEPITAWSDARRLGLRARVLLFCSVCAAVQHAHERFVVHRDLKPGNILVDNDGHPRVLDFGVAKRIDQPVGSTQLGAFAGFTPEYAAPEQIRGGMIAAATDVYALGVVLYQLLTGRLPITFDQLDLRAATEAITSRAATRLDQGIGVGAAPDTDARLRQRDTDLHGFRRFVRGDLSRIVETALAKEPQRRYASVQALSSDLLRFLHGRTVSVSGDTYGYRVRTFVRRNRWGTAMAVLAAALLLAGIGGVALQSQRAQREAMHANQEAVRAERQAARARLEAERLAASNEFLRSVFSAAAPGNAGTPNISLRDALHLATRQLQGTRTDMSNAQVQVRFLLAAASSFEALGDSDAAQGAAQRALRIQETYLPKSNSDRASVLSTLAWQRMNFEPKRSLAWAREAVVLYRAGDPVDATGLREAYSVLGNAQYVNGDVAGAIDTARAGRKAMRDSGMPQDNVDVITAYSNEALMLAGLARYDEAIAAHREVIRLRGESVGADSVATALERVYFAFTLNRARRFDEALAQLEQARPRLRRELGERHDSTQLANLGLGRALVGLGRAQEAAVPLASAQAYAHEHGFDGRQDVVAYWYARALVDLGRCTQAHAVAIDLATRRIAWPADLGDPRAGTRCAAATVPVTHAPSAQPNRD